MAEASTIIEAAMAWADGGFHPIGLHGLQPDASCACSRGACCRSAGKHPVSRDWQAGPLDDTALVGELARGQRNIGLRMGAQPDGRNLIAIDVDGDAGLMSLVELIRDRGTLPATVTQRTGSGGLHLVFEWAPDEFSAWRAQKAGLSVDVFRAVLGQRLPTTSSSKLAPNIDIRGQGGQIVAAPSLHQSGRRYALLRAGEHVALPAPTAVDSDIDHDESYRYAVVASDSVAVIPHRWLDAILASHSTPPRIT